MKRFIIYILCIFLAALCFVPDSSAALYEWTDADGTVNVSDDPGTVSSVYPNSMKVIPGPVAVGEGRIIPFERMASGHILVDVVVNGRKAKMVVDTGASNVVISEALLKRLNLDLSPAAEVIRLHTDHGDVEGRLFEITIEIGDAIKEDVLSVVVPNDSIFVGFDGLLGLSFLEDFKVTIDYKEGQIILGE